MSKGSKIRHLHRISDLVNGLQTYLEESGQGDSVTKRKLIEIRMALLDEVEEELDQKQPFRMFTTGRTPNPL